VLQERVEPGATEHADLRRRHESFGPFAGAGLRSEEGSFGFEDEEPSDEDEEPSDDDDDEDDEEPSDDDSLDDELSFVEEASCFEPSCLVSPFEPSFERSRPRSDSPFEPFRLSVA
jgi:hypothetical protein